jgi:hypothetical protein
VEIRAAPAVTGSGTGSGASQGTGSGAGQAHAGTAGRLRLPHAAAAPVDEVALEIVDGTLKEDAAAREHVSLRLLPPLSANDPGTDAVADNALVARVIVSQTGELLLETPLGLIVPDRRLAATPDTMLRFELLSRAPLPTRDQPPAHPATEGQPASAAPPLPAPGGAERMTAALHLLLAALPGTMPRLSDAVTRALRRARETAAGTGTAAPSEARLLDDGSGRLWRLIQLPWPHDGVRDPLLLHREPRRDHSAGEHGAGGHGGEAERFILELSLGTLGPVQLDGFYRHERFDLVLRSHLPLREDVRHEVDRRFRERLAAGALSGAVSFAVAAHFPVSALADPAPVGIEV